MSTAPAPHDPARAAQDGQPAQRSKQLPSPPNVKKRDRLVVIDSASPD